MCRVMEGCEGKVEGEEARVMMVMLKGEGEERRAERIWEPIVPLAFRGLGGLVGLFCFVGLEVWFWGRAYSYEGDVLDVVVVGHCCGW